MEFRWAARQRQGNLLPLAARSRLNRKSELPETCGGLLIAYCPYRPYLEPVQPRSCSKPYAFSCSLINQHRSLPVSFSSCTIHQTSHCWRYGHILDFLPLSADRSTSSSLEPAATPNPKQVRSITLSWLRAPTSVNLSIHFLGLISMQLSRAARIILVGAPGMSELNGLSTTRRQ